MITYISLFITALSCIYIFVKFILTKSEFQSKIRTLLSDIKETPDLLNNESNSMNEANLLFKQIKSYQRGFNKNKKTEISAHSIFKIESIASPNFNLRKYSGYNNTLIGLGIFFTFLGLTIGVGYFGYKLTIVDANNQTTAITEGINVLMGGMGTAFISSVIGMGFSIWFSNMFKEEINLVEHELNLISSELDTNHLMSQADMINTLGLTYTDAQHGERGIASINNLILEQSRRQANSLDTFSQDLADSIYEAFNRTGEGEGGESLAETLKAGFSEMTTELKSTLEVLVKDVKENSGGAIISEAEKAAQHLSELTKVVGEMPAIVSEINKSTKENSLNTQGIITATEEILEKQLQVIEEQKKAATEIEKATKIYADTRSQMNLSLDYIKTSTRKLSESIDEFVKENTSILNHRLELDAKSDATLLNFGNIISETTQLKNDLLTDMTKIEASLEKVFENITTGLNGYHDRIENNIKEELDIYSSSVETIVKSLSGAINLLDSKIEDLDDTLGKYLSK